MLSRNANVLVVLLFLLPGSALAQTAAPVTIPVRTGEHDAYDRIVLDAPKGTDYTLTRDEKSATLTLSRPGLLKMGAWYLSRAPKPEITHGVKGDENIVLRLTLAPGVIIKNFKSGSSIVLDLFGPGRKTAVQATPKTHTEEKPTPQKALEPAPTKTTESVAEKTLPLKAPEPPQTKAAEPTTEKAPTVSAPVAEVKTPTPAPAPAPASAPVPASAPLAAVETVIMPPESLPSPAQEHFTSAQIQKIRELAARTPPEMIASFDPGVDSGAVVFERGGYITFLSDKKFAGSFLKEPANTELKIEKVDLVKNTAFRIAIPSGISVRAMKNGTAWELFLVPGDASPGVSTEFVAQPDFALGARLLLSTAAPATPVRLEDPVVGDKLILVPLSSPGAFTLLRKFVDLEVIPAAQGLVLKPWNETVVARPVAEGIEITAEGGLRLSPVRDTGLTSPQSKAKQLFDFERWQGRAGESYTETRQKLAQTIVDVAEKDKVLARLDLARFYFAHEFVHEALALLLFVQEDLPEVNNQPEFIALRGACRIMIGDLDAGRHDFENESLARYTETTLWLAIANAKKRDWFAAMDGFKKVGTLIADYPAPFRKQFRLLMIETALAGGFLNDAGEWLDAFAKESGDAGSQQAADYLRGVLFASSGQAEKAAPLWHKAVKGPDRLYKIRAELALVDLGVANKSLSPLQAADRLEGLRFAWRGDDLEFDILRRLGKFYLDAGEVKKGLGVLAQAVRLFPADSQTPALKTSMVRAFRELLLSNDAGGLEPLDALSLFSEFGYMIPQGPENNDVRLALVDRLVNIDLLDQAASLLEEISSHAANPEEKAKTATRLAGVKLLDSRAEDALAVLDKSEIEGLSEQTRMERLLLRARALSDLGRYEEARAIIPLDAGTTASLLTADIALRAHQWRDAADILLALVGTPPKSGSKLSPEQTDWLTNAAVALAQTGAWDQLETLGTTYAGSLGVSAKADLFRVLTQPEDGYQIKDLSSAEARLADVDLFRSFLNAYRSSKTP